MLELIAISGDFSTDLLYRLPGGITYKEAIIKALKKECLIRVFYRDQLRTYRLTARAKSLLLADQPERFAFYLEGGADTNLLKGEITRRLRLYQISVVYVNMELAGVQIFRDRKPDVFSPGDCDISYIEEPTFYNSREVKEDGVGGH